MIKPVVLVVLGFIALCFPVAAQQSNRADEFDADVALSLYRPEILSSVDYSTLLQGLPLLTLLDGRYLPVSSELGQMGMAPVDLFSEVSLSVAEVERIIVRPEYKKDLSKDSPAEMVSPPLNPVHYGGEVGFLYGHSSGKFGGDLFESYLVGGVGDDKVHISVGAAYEESSWRVPRARH